MAGVTLVVYLFYQTLMKSAPLVSFFYLLRKKCVKCGGMDIMLDTVKDFLFELGMKPDEKASLSLD